jgi:hypothetical protein
MGRPLCNRHEPYAQPSLSNFTQDLIEWDVRNVLDTASMFEGAPTFNQALYDWNVRNVKVMSAIFAWDVGYV